MQIIGEKTYRVWSHNGANSESSQLTRLDLLAKQIENASSKFKDVVIMGDANLDSNKWNDDKFLHKKAASALKDTLNSNNLFYVIYITLII